jgi:hypothetical protein
MKLCQCGKLVTLRDKRNKDGLQKRCNECTNELRRKKYKLNPQKHKDRQKKYNDYSLEKAKRNTKNLTDTYIISELKRGTNLTAKDIRKHPELIEAKRQIIKIKRLCKILKN